MVRFAAHRYEVLRAARERIPEFDVTQKLNWPIASGSLPRKPQRWWVADRSNQGLGSGFLPVA